LRESKPGDSYRFLTTTYIEQVQLAIVVAEREGIAQLVGRIVQFTAQRRHGDELITLPFLLGAHQVNRRRCLPVVPVTRVQVDLRQEDALWRITDLAPENV
jgi:hypothetical protein